MSDIAYIKRGKEAAADGFFEPIVVIDGVGDFPAERLDEVVRALVDLQQQIQSDAASGLKAKGRS
jgi:hypothetical protein